jgi:MinD-like ATPase involved in chromosome partitioning or flagellar assembly
MGRSFAFVSSRGGVGKSTLAAQLSAAYATSHPNATVILIDSSVHADSSSFLVGGMQAPDDGDSKSMSESILARNNKNFAALLNALIAAPAQTTSFSRLWGRAPAPPSSRVNVLDYALKPSDVWASGEAPANLHVLPGGRALTSITAETAPVMASALAELVRSSPTNYTFIFDTDAELRERVASTIACVAAEKIIVVTSSMWSDFLRILTDPSNSLIDFLNDLATANQNARKIAHFVFTNIPKTRNDPSALHGTEVLSFKPDKEASNNIEQIVSYVFERANDGPFRPLLTMPIESQITAFTKSKVSGVFAINEKIIQKSTLMAQPIVCMTTSASTPDALETAQTALVYAATRVFS